MVNQDSIDCQGCALLGAVSRLCLKTRATNRTNRGQLHLFQGLDSPTWDANFLVASTPCKGSETTAVGNTSMLSMSARPTPAYTGVTGPARGWMI